jgi:hypothetical protein
MSELWIGILVGLNVGLCVTLYVTGLWQDTIEDWRKSNEEWSRMCNAMRAHSERVLDGWREEICRLGHTSR